MWTDLRLAVLVISLVLGLVQPALAELGDISIGGVWVCRLTKGAGSLTLEQRVQEIERNMYAVVNNPKYRAQGRVPVSVRGSAIMVENLVILTVSPEDVAGTGAKPAEAANQWAQRLAKRLNHAIPVPNPSGL